MATESPLMEKLTALCKRRGFIFPSSEIYGGIGGFWDYGPLGVELKRNIKEAWWHDMVTNPPDGPDGRELTMLGLDCTIIMNPRVWEASGHATGFADTMVDCKACKSRFRADQLIAIELRPLDSEDDFHFLIYGQGDAQEVRAANEKRVAKLQKAHGELVSVSGFLRYDQLNEAGRSKFECPECGQTELTEPREFNLMFTTYVGAVRNDDAKTYLRPETAQGIFANFRNVLDTSRVKLPFGVAQVGKAFRNEINPRNYTFRSREFEQMEIEFFCKGEELCGPSEPKPLEWWEWWRDVRINWYKSLGLAGDRLRPRNQGPQELAHYSKACTDIEYLFPFSDEPQELEGVAHRGCYDLQQHQTHSGRDMSYFDDDGWQAFVRGRQERGEPELTKAEKAEAQKRFRFLPTVIEPSAGADRSTLAFLCEAYTEDQAPDEKGVMQSRVVMKFHPRLAPIKAAFFPLVNRENMPDVAYALYREAKRHLNVQYDEGGAIGRRYRRQDEAGTPFCVTVDGKTVSTDSSDPEAGTVTIRDRDTLAQVRVPREGVCRWLREKLGLSAP